MTFFLACLYAWIMLRGIIIVAENAALLGMRFLFPGAYWDGVESRRLEYERRAGTVRIETFEWRGW